MVAAAASAVPSGRVATAIAVPSLTQVNPAGEDTRSPHHNDWTGMSLRGRLWLQLVEWQAGWHLGQRRRNAAVLDI